MKKGLFGKYQKIGLAVSMLAVGFLLGSVFQNHYSRVACLSIGGSINSDGRSVCVLDSGEVSAANIESVKLGDPLERRCFEKMYTNDNGVSGLRYVELLIYEDGLVSGIDNWLPPEAESNTGSFKGDNFNGELFEAVYLGSGEGETWLEERFYRVVEQGISLGYPEDFVMYEDNNGVYRYDDRSDISYNELVPEIECL